ncbi:MAG TPA: hypothetical protein VKS21_03530, partial [Spirochaetota bacterium]|nr:hypothetical protein [Spirochaetota bacterium]
KDVLQYFNTPGLNQLDPEPVVKLTPARIKQYLFYRLMVRKAVRLGYARSLAFRYQLHKVRNQLLADELYKREYFSAIDVTENEIKDFYFKHKKKYKKPYGGYYNFSDIQDRVRADVRQIRAAEQKNNLLQELSRDENLEILINLDSLSAAETTNRTSKPNKSTAAVRTGNTGKEDSSAAAGISSVSASSNSINPVTSSAAAEGKNGSQ